MEDFFIWGPTAVPTSSNSTPESPGSAQPSADLMLLTVRVNRLALASQAKWELLRSHTNLTEADLKKKITEIDLRDGILDGKMGAQVLECPKCLRNSNSRNQHCIWCGAPISKAHIFEG